MPRRDKDRRRKHREQKRNRNQRRSESVIDSKNAAGKRQVLTYEVTYDPIPDRNDGSRDIAEILGQIEREALYDETLARPAEAIAKLESLLELHPDVPTLYNWLATCCMRSGKQERGIEVIRLNFERNPRYLFARLNYAELCLRAHAPEAAAVVMGNQWDLKAIYPERATFHITEFVGLSAVAIEYFMQVDQRDTAERMLSMLKQIAPDAQVTASMMARVLAAPQSRSTAGVSPFAAKSEAIPEDLLDRKD